MKSINGLIVSFVVIVIFLSPPLFSQPVKVISATRQRWAGGICCRSGINYHIELKIAKTKHSLTLDSLWMDGYCTDISKYYDKAFNSRDSAVIILSEGVNWDEGMPIDNWCYDGAKKGVLLSYYIDGRKKWLVITPSIKELEFQAYP